MTMDSDKLYALMRRWTKGDETVVDDVVAMDAKDREAVLAHCDALKNRSSMALKLHTAIKARSP